MWDRNRRIWNKYIETCKITYVSHQWDVRLAFRQIRDYLYMYLETILITGCKNLQYICIKSFKSIISNWLSLSCTICSFLIKPEHYRAHLRGNLEVSFNMPLLGGRGKLEHLCIMIDQKMCKAFSNVKFVLPVNHKSENFWGNWLIYFVL